MSRLYGDSLRLKQVLINLLSNSVKFANDGDVSISIETHEPHCHKSDEDEEDIVWLKFTVSDTGRGIDAAELSNVFGRFMQSSTGEIVSDEFQGTGLGLFISLKLAHYMRGK